MPTWILGLMGSLGGVAVQMMIKSIGYEFISRAAVIVADGFAKSTPTHRDDLVVEAWAKALGVSPEVLKEQSK